MLHQIFERLEVDRADIEVAVGGQQHAIDAAGYVGLFRHGIGQTYASTAIGRATCRQAGQGGAYCGFLIARRGLQYHAGIAGIHHQRHPVLGAQLLH